LVRHQKDRAAEENLHPTQKSLDRGTAPSAPATETSIVGEWKDEGLSAVPSIGRAESETTLLGAQTEAAEGLYNRHHRSVYAFCLARLRDRDEAADAVQTTFMYALGALRRGVTPSFEVPWLLTIARNVCRTRGAARTRRRHLELATDPQELADLAPAPERVELLAGIDDALARLPEQQRRAVLLRDWQGLSYKEVADELGVSLAAAETMIFRGRSALARELSGGETRKRRFSLGSLLGLFRLPTVGGGAGAAAKLAFGTALVLGAGVAGTKELAHRPPSAQPRVQATVPAPRSHVDLVASAPIVARRGSLPARRNVVALRRAHPHAVPAPTPTRRRAAAAAPAPAPVSVPARPTSPATPSAAPAAAPAPPAAVPAPAPATPAAPAPAPPAPPAPAPASPQQAADPPPPPAPPAPADASEPAPAAPPADPVTDVATPVVTTVTQAAPAAARVEPVVTAVAAVTEPVEPVVTTVTSPVSGVVTSAETPVVTTVTSTLPPPPPLPHLP
jgi:RNA polymerase sigma factor (sigma-70 family)